MPNIYVLHHILGAIANVSNSSLIRLEQIIRLDWTTWNIPLGRTSSFSIFSQGNWTSKEHSGHTKCFCIPSWWYGGYYGSETGSSWTGSAVFCTSIHTDEDYDWMASLKPFLWPNLEACCLIVTDTNMFIFVLNSLSHTANIAHPTPWFSGCGSWKCLWVTSDTTSLMNTRVQKLILFDNWFGIYKYRQTRCQSFTCKIRRKHAWWNAHVQLHE